MTEKVMAAIDGSQFSQAVCDCAAWASLALEVPLTFLHVNDNHAAPSEQDLSGNLSLGAREHLMEELSRLDEERARVAQEQGRLMLQSAKERATEYGVNAAGTRQRNGTLVETLEELQDETRLLVLGKRGEGVDQASEHLGSNLERVIRTLHRPILMVPDSFNRPEKVLMAFDGNRTTRKGVELLARSPLFEGVTVHVLIVGADLADNRAQLEWALETLRGAGHEAEGAIRAGEVESTLHAYQQEQGIDMLVMGAYGHSRIRHLLVGSTTTDMLRRTRIPLLLLR
ncbi:universal stress protein [Salicola sp. Rm-C-2C1-2]|uniref:universal stress protein n=1 Tax=Salicola sp. Rm-C-2C1-2 TaxID=3141321 RepID=UPI0032E45002